MNYAQIMRVENLARAKYTYKHDPVGDDRWRSHHDEVLAGAAWADDCDSLASTVINLLAREGASLDRMFFANVSSAGRRDGSIDHMIAFALDDHNQIWVVGDTFGPCYDAKQMRHVLVKFCKVSNINQWFAASDPRQMLLV